MKNFRYQILDKETSRATYVNVEADNLTGAIRAAQELHSTKKMYSARENWQVFENGAWVWCI